MPASERSLAITDAYRRRLILLAERVVSRASADWQQLLELRDLDGSHARWIERASVLLAAAQRAGVILTTAYLTAFLSSELGRPANAQAVDAEQFVAKSRDGSPITEALVPSLYTVKAAIKDGKNSTAALAEGLARARRVVEFDTLDAPRNALDSMIAGDGRIVGWRRVTSGGCGACIAAATGAIQREATVLKVHDHCKCTKEPVISEVVELAHRPTGREMFDSMPPSAQDELLGAEKASLIRSGSVPLERLIAISPMETTPDQITEAPLSALHQ